MHSTKNLVGKAGAGVAAVAIAAGALTVSTLGGAEASAGPGKVVDASPGVSANVAGRAGWQGKFTFSLPTGSGGVYFHYPCPSGFTARSGSYDVNAVGQPGVKITGTGGRWDTNYTEWFTLALWPAGAPAGTQISYDVYCTKGGLV